MIGIIIFGILMIIQQRAQAIKEGMPKDKVTNLTLTLIIFNLVLWGAAYIFGMAAYWLVIIIVLIAVWILK